MNKFQLYYTDICVGHIVKESTHENVIHGSIEYEQLDQSLSMHNHIRDFINKLIKMTDDIAAQVKEKLSRDESESAKKAFEAKWAPYEDLTSRGNWFVFDSKGKKFEISTPMFQDSNKVLCSIIDNSKK